MKQEFLSNESFADYYLRMNLENDLQVNDLKLTTKVVTIKKTGEKRMLLHVTGTQVTTGLVLNMDIWPRNEMSDEQMEEIAKLGITDALVRIGYWNEIDEQTFKPVLKTGKPKWFTLFAGNKEIIPDGDFIEFVDYAALPDPVAAVEEQKEEEQKEEEQKEEEQKEEEQKEEPKAEEAPAAEKAAE